MQAIRSLFSAFANLAAAVNGFAATIRTADARLQESLDYAPTAPQVEHAEVLDNMASSKRGRK
jgi:hypothetical protein